MPTLTPLPRLNVAALQNATYHSPDFGELPLVEGTYHAGEAETGTTTTLSDWIAFGDLDADGQEDAVIILTTQSSGSGVFVELAAVLNHNGMPVTLSSVALGDRVRIEELTLEAGLIQLDVVVPGPEDPLCCPTQVEQQRLRLVDAQLKRLP